jgi:hypothetical protein
VVASQEKITASWTAIENTDPNVTLNYCVSEVNPNLPDPTSDDYQLTNDSEIIDCTSETTVDIFDIRYQNTNETKYFVQVQAQSGALSARSEIATITTPKQPNVVGLTVSSASDGLNIKWNSSGIDEANQVIYLHIGFLTLAFILALIITLTLKLTLTLIVTIHLYLDLTLSTLTPTF